MISLTTRLLSSLVPALLLIPTAQAADGVTLEVSAGDAAYENVVVETVLPAALANQNQFELTQIDTGELVPIQVDRHGREPKLVWIVPGKLGANTVRRYRLTSASKPSQPNRVSVNDDGKHLLVKVGQKPVFRYNHATVPSPDAKHPYYARSGYIHPLYNPSGQIITDDFNPDHAHQHGIMLAWRKMTFDGRETNGWDQQAGLGKVEHASLDEFGGGPVFGYFKARLRHVDLTAPDARTPVLDETWAVRVYAFDDAFQFDITSTQTCASAQPVSIDRIHYGGMTIRGHADWHEHGNFDYLTSEGKSKTDGNQTRPRWVDLFGPLAGQTTGTLIMDHKDNFRFPQPVRLHPTMPYFCFTPASLESFTIKPGTPYVSRYRFYVHDGALNASMADRLWHQYSRSPKVHIAKSDQ